jgi:glycosyltransferase involved in cell wall biosynthesis
MISDESSTYRLVQGGTPASLKLSFAWEATPGFLSIVIPVYHDVEGLNDTLGSLLTANAPRSRFEIIVVNDGASEEVEDLCRKYGVTSIALTPNRGSYAARNAGIAAARGELIGLLDADVVVAPTWLEAAFAALAKQDMTAGRIRMKVTPKPTLTELFQIVSYFPDTRLLQEHKFITTANLAVRRRVFEQIGGFDSRLRSGGDYEFSSRTAEAGFALGFSPEMMVTHPCRNYEQLVPSIRRTLYGQANLHTLYGDRFQNTAMKLPSVWKLLVPRRHLVQNEVPGLRLTARDRVRLFFFAWWLKLLMIPMVLSVKKQARKLG